MVFYLFEGTNVGHKAKAKSKSFVRIEELRAEDGEFKESDYWVGKVLAVCSKRVMS